MTPTSAEQVAGEPLVVHTHVTPWGFIVALPLGLAFAYLGALTFDSQIVPARLDGIGELPFWLFSAILVVFALFMFLIGIAELANYLRPSVEVIMDSDGVTTWGVLGERRTRWDDIVEAEVGEGQLTLRARTGRQRGSLREVRLQFNRLAAEPADLIERLGQCRPDLACGFRPA